MLLAAAILAIVTQDSSSLRSAPTQKAPVNAVLWQGEVVEVRGARLGYLQVYNYQRERAGYVLESQVRSYDLERVESAALLETIRFLRDVHGMEALGIGHVALFLKTAPAGALDAEVFDALGTMGDRLARRASARSGRAGDALAGHLDVARSYGVQIETIQTEGRTVTCYDGEAFRRALALLSAEATRAAARPPGLPAGTPPRSAAASAELQARAALALTRPECQQGTESQLRAALSEAAEILDRVPLDSLPPLMRNRVHLRRAPVWAGLAFSLARAGETGRAREASGRAIKEIALVPRSEMPEAESEALAEAFVRVGATRPALDDAGGVTAKVAWRLVARAQGQTCLVLTEQKGDADADREVHCTYGVVWPNSIRVAPKGAALVAAVQPLAGWRELLVVRLVDGEWRAETVAPGPELGLGYVEWAGFTPDGQGLLVAREVKEAGRVRRSFELLDVASLTVQRKADRPQDLTPFQKWHAPEWRLATLALR